MKNKGRKVLYIMMAIILLLLGIVLLYVNDDYDATDEALLALETTETIQVAG